MSFGIIANSFLNKYGLPRVPFRLSRVSKEHELVQLVFAVTLFLVNEWYYYTWYYANANGRMDTLENQNIDVDVSDTPELSSAWIEVDLEDFQ